EINLGKLRAALPGDFERGRLQIHRVNFHRDVALGRPAHDHARDVARTGGEIEDAPGAPRREPFAQKKADKLIAAEVAVELAKAFEALFKLGADRLRAVEHLRLGFVKNAPHFLKRISRRRAGWRQRKILAL